MRSLIGRGRTEPSLRRSDAAPAADPYAEPPLRARSQSDPDLQAAPAFAGVFSARPPVLAGEQAAPQRQRAEALAPAWHRDEPSLSGRTLVAEAQPLWQPSPPLSRLPGSAKVPGQPVASDADVDGAAPQPEPALAKAEAPRKRIGIPLRWLETRSETRARQERDRRREEDLAQLAADEAALPPQPMRAMAADTMGYAGQAAVDFAGDHQLSAGAQAEAAAMAWVSGAEVGRSHGGAGRAEPPLGRASEVWSPVLPAQSAPRPEPSLQRGADAAPRGAVNFASYGSASDQAVAAARYWPNDPRAAEPTLTATSAQSSVEDGEDDEDVPFRPWLHPDPQARDRLAAVPGRSGSGVVLSDQGVARPKAAPAGPWSDLPAGAFGHDLSQDTGEPGWDQFYAEPDDAPQPALSQPIGDSRGFAADHDSHAASQATFGVQAPAPSDFGAEAAGAAAFSGRRSFNGATLGPASAKGGWGNAAPAMGFAAEDAPEAPMIEDRGPRRDQMRRDPAPSRTAYRLQRMWLTPLYRALLRKGLPAFALVFACGVALQDQGRRDAIVTWAADLRATITERPEFMLLDLKVDGASVETEAAVRQALAVTLPVSSFDLELPALQAKAAAVPAVASAALHVRQGGVLEVIIEERKPVVVWRSETGIGTLDQTGHRVADLQNRLERPDLPLIVGLGAEAAVPEALRLYQAAGPIRDRVRGLIRVGERRWDLIVDPAIRVMLPAKDPVPALEQVVALHEAQILLDRDITAVDLRNPSRATVRMGEPAAETWRLNLAALKGK